MQPHLKIFVGILATGIPIAAAAQMSGQYGQQGAAQQPPRQSSSLQTEQAKPAKAADIKAGAAVFDSKGESLGKVDSVDAEGAVLAIGSARVKVPLSSLAVGDKGLTLSVTKAELEAMAEKKKSEKP